MTFLNSLFLWALPLMSLPLILHLIHKRPPKPMVFSYVPWLRAVHRAAMPRKKLREILLLILRTLMFVCLVLFFSRPVLIHSPKLSAESENSTVVFLIDVSASMGARVSGRTALQVAVDELPPLLRQMPNETRFGFLAYSNQVEQELTPTQERSRFLAAINNLKVMPRPTDISSALQIAYQMLNNQPSGRKSIVIVSDQAENGYETLLKSGERPNGYDPDVSVVAWEVAPEISNTGIRSATVALSSEGVLKGSFVAASSKKSNSVPLWSLKLNERVVGQGKLDHPSDVGESVPIQAQLPEGGFYSGRIDLTPDALPFDDSYFVAGRVPKGFRLLMVDGESGLAPSDSEVYYLKLALESPRDPRLQALTLVRPEGLKDQNLNQFDVIVLANTSGLDESVAENLQAWVQAGGGLFVTAGSKWPRAPEGPLNLIRTRDTQKGKFILAKPVVDSELSHLPGIDQFDWPEIEINTFRPADQISNTTPILLTDKGDPLLLKKQLGRGTVLVWLTTIDRAWTNLPAKPLFSPLVRELIASLADPLRAQSTLSGYVGQPLQIRLPSDLRGVTVIDPDGKSSGGRVGETGILNWTSTPVPGLYHVQTGDQKNDFNFAINIAGLETEGNTQRIKTGLLKSIFPQSSVEWIGFQSNSREGILAALQGKDLTKLLSWLLLIFFLTETLLSGKIWTYITLKKAAVAALFLLLLPGVPSAGDGNKFVYGQLRHAGAWDPYPNIHTAVLDMIQTMTNIPFVPERKVVTLSDPSLFECPFLLIKGNSDFVLTPKEKSELKNYIEGGGFVFIDDTLANPQSPFANSIRKLFSDLYPDRPFERLSNNHAVFRSFFLLRGMGGRRISEKYLEGLEVGGRSGGEGRTAVIFCANDLMGTWMKDHVGEYTFSCDPGGDPQRWESFKLTLNIVYFSLTGTYKRDAIHQPFIERKLGS